MAASASENDRQYAGPKSGSTDVRVDRRQLRAIERAGVRLPRLTEDVWVGSDGRISRVGFAIPFVQQGVSAKSSMTMTFRAYDVPASVSAPPSSQVFDFS